MNKIRYILSIVLLTIPFLIIAQDNKQEIIQNINSLSVNTNKATYENLLKEFANTGGDIKDIECGILNTTNNGNYNIIPVIELIVLPSQNNIKSLIDYYINTGISIGAFCNNPSKAIEYLITALELAENNNLNKKLFSSLNGHIKHVWGNIAVNYERQNDIKNAATAYLKAAKEIRKYYPENTKDYDELLSVSSYLIFKYLTEIYKGNNSYVEYSTYIKEYSSVGNLKGLSALWNHFIDSHDINGLILIENEIIPKEKDHKTMAEFYWAAAEQFQHDEFYQEAINYHLKLIAHSILYNIKEYLFTEYEGIKHSRFEQAAYCFDKLGDNENFVQSIFHALNEVGLEFGSDSEEFKYYTNYMCIIMEDPVKRVILEKKLTEMGIKP